MTMAEERSSWAPSLPSQIRACWMCGTQLPSPQLIADGSAACSDIRWYCRDVRRCTERWTSHRGVLSPMPAGAVRA
ncbi:MAG TPA: hypothetical protein VGI64_12415 [Streptosporangiaceae bacterium]